MPGCAKRVAQLCKDCGLTLTGAGSAYPYHKDPADAHPAHRATYPSLDEVETASDLLCVCVRLAAVEKLLLRTPDSSHKTPAVPCRSDLRSEDLEVVS